MGVREFWIFTERNKIPDFSEEVGYLDTANFDMTEILANLDANALVQEHLELCDYKVCGYWDEQDKYYEELILPRSLIASLISSSIGVTDTKRFLQLKFVLLASSPVADTKPNNMNSLGTLTLIYDENLEFVDENWVIDINCLGVQARQA